jgi:hypothetical protein
MGESCSEGSSPRLATLLSSAAKLLRAYNVGMRTLCITLMGLAMAGGVWAQQEPAAPSGTFYRPEGWGAGKSFSFNGEPVALPPTPVQAPPAVTRCAIPLIQMQAPASGDAAVQFVPPTDKVDPMPRANLPPACDAAASR